MYYKVNLCAIVLSCAICSAAFATTATSYPRAEPNIDHLKTAKLYSPRIDIGGFYRNKSRSFGLTDLFVPVLQSYRHLMFLDIRGLAQQQDNFEINLGTGYRYLSKRNFIFGMYGFFDRRYSQYGNQFNQINLGTEFRTEKLFIGANGYIPISDKTYKSHKADFGSPAFQSGDTFYIVVDGYDRQEIPMAGFDAQVGWHWPQRSGLSTYVGGYYFTADNAPTVAGPRGTLTLDLLPIINADAESLAKVEIKSMVQYDKPRGLGWMLGARLSFQLGKNKSEHLSLLAKQMTAYVHRDLDIVAEEAPYAGEEFLKKSNGENVVGEYVSSTDELNDSTAPDSGIDVIVVEDEITYASEEGINLQKGQSLTGDRFSFSYQGNDYITSLAGYAPLKTEVAPSVNGAHILVPTGDSDSGIATYETQIRDITLNTDDPDRWVVLKDEDNKLHSKLIIDGIIANGGISLTSNGTRLEDSSGEVSIINNRLGTASSSSEEAISLIAEGEDGSIMAIGSIASNVLYSSGDNSIVIASENNSTVNLTGGIINNNLTPEGSDKTILLLSTVGSELTVDSMITNQLHEAYLQSTASSSITVNGFNTNTFSTEGAINIGVINITADTGSTVNVTVGDPLGLGIVSANGGSGVRLDKIGDYNSIVINPPS